MLHGGGSRSGARSTTSPRPLERPVQRTVTQSRSGPRLSQQPSLRSTTSAPAHQRAPAPRSPLTRPGASVFRSSSSSQKQQQQQQQQQPGQPTQKQHSQLTQKQHSQHSQPTQPTTQSTTQPTAARTPAQPATRAGAAAISRKVTESGGGRGLNALPGRGITRAAGGGGPPTPEEMPRRDFPFKPHQKPAGDFASGQRTPRKRALVVGCNYVMAPDIQLRGACNDAAAVALSLINSADFRAEEVVLLLDQWPAPAYRNARFAEAGLEEEEADGLVLWKDRQPTRRNILLGLNWLRMDCRDGDVLLFYFAGHGIQIDDMSGWEGEGYDEALLPMDFFGAEVNVLTAVHIRHALVNVGCGAQLTVVLDCAGGQTALDPTGTGSAWRYIAGLKQRGVWPFVTDSTDKVKRATYSSAAWLAPEMQRRGARPRFVPGVDVSSVAALADPALQRIPDFIESQLRGFLFAAAPWSQTPLEAKLPPLKIYAMTDSAVLRQVAPQPTKKQYVYHGVFTWCWLSALSQLFQRQLAKHFNRRVTFAELLAETQNKVRWLRTPEGGLGKIAQLPELTFLKNGGATADECIFWHGGGRQKNLPFSARPSHRLPCLPHETRYLSAWEAESEWNRVQRRMHFQMCAQAKDGACPHFKLPRAPNLQLDALQKHEMLGAPAMA